jgi:ABC-type glucose/galactose transport system permease subunit
METVAVVLIPVAIVAVTEFLKRLNKKDYEGCITIIVAVVIGGLAGVINLKGLDVTTGLIAGLEAVGVHTLVVSRASSKTVTPAV